MDEIVIIKQYYNKLKQGSCHIRCKANWVYRLNGGTPFVMWQNFVLRVKPLPFVKLHEYRLFYPLLYNRKPYHLESGLSAGYHHTFSIFTKFFYLTKNEADANLCCFIECFDTLRFLFSSSDLSQIKQNFKLLF